VLSVISKPALVNWAAKVEREMVVKVAADLYEDLRGTSTLSRVGYLTTIENRLGKEKAAKKQLDAAGDLGRQVHELIEWTLKKQLGIKVGSRPQAIDKAEWAFMAWEDWMKQAKVKPLFIEQVVYSSRYGYAGTLDLGAEVDGVLTIIDWKTGKAVYPEAHLQNAAYRQGLREMGHGDPKAGMIVRLPKVETDPEFEVVEAKPEEIQFPHFLHALSLWTWAQEGEAAYQAKKKAAELPEVSQPARVQNSVSNTQAGKTEAPPEEPIKKPRTRRKGGVPMAEIPELPPAPAEPHVYKATDADVPF
jgi:hypothetical protein